MSVDDPHGDLFTERFMDAFRRPPGLPVLTPWLPGLPGIHDPNRLERRYADGLPLTVAQAWTVEEKLSVLERLARKPRKFHYGQLTYDGAPYRHILREYASLEDAMWDMDRRLRESGLFTIPEEP